MNIAVLTSELALFMLASLLLGLDLVLPKTMSRRSLGYLAAAGLVGVFAYTCSLYGRSEYFMPGIFLLDNFAVFFKQLFLLAVGLSILFSLGYVERLAGYQGEFYALLLLALCGMMMMVSATDLLTLFISIELMSISFYVLVGMNFNNKKSSEAGVKYLVLGSLSSAAMLYGISWVYGACGSIVLAEISLVFTASPAMLLGMSLILTGLCFKMAVVPLHLWAPDVYEGAPIPITAVLAMSSETAAIAACLRLFLEAFAPLQSYWLPLVSGAAVLSMIVGNVAAIWQNDIKRLLAYSSISQAGYMLSGLIAANAAGVKGTMFYGMLYVFANVGAFAVVTAVQQNSGSSAIRSFSGLAQRAPFLAAVMLVSLLSMAGIPPMAGFAGKLYLFTAVAEQGYLWVAMVGFLMSMISVYYYLLVVKAMYMHKAEAQTPFVSGLSLRLAAGIGLFFTLLLGVYPEPLAALSTVAAAVLW